MREYKYPPLELNKSEARSRLIAFVGVGIFIIIIYFGRIYSSALFSNTEKVIWLIGLLFGQYAYWLYLKWTSKLRAQSIIQITDDSLIETQYNGGMRVIPFNLIDEIIEKKGALIVKMKWIKEQRQIIIWKEIIGYNDLKTQLLKIKATQNQ